MIGVRQDHEQLYIVGIRGRPGWSRAATSPKRRRKRLNAWRGGGSPAEILSQHPIEIFGDTAGDIVFVFIGVNTVFAE